MNKPLLFLDTETTGLGNCRLVELAYVLEKGKPFTLRCSPPIPIEFGAMAVHHITEEDVASLPRFQTMPEYQEVQKLLNENILVAHNALFDIGVLEREGLRVGQYLDTKEIAQHLVKEAENHRLQYLRYYLGCKVKGAAHSADGDVAVLKAVWEALVSRFNNQEDIVLHFTRTR